MWRYDHGALEFNGKHVTDSTSVDSSGQAFLGSTRLVDRLQFCHVDSFQVADESDQETVPFQCRVRLCKWKTVSRCLGSETRFLRKSSTTGVEADLASV